ncbi:hypothetical protein ACTFIW_003157 [Dictyostelium discoideum]
MINNNNNNKQYKLSEPFNYENDYQYGLNDQLSFWNDVAKKYVHWDKEYENIYNSNNEWFSGGLLNACYNALDKHIVNGRGEDIAFVHEIPSKQISTEITYKQLFDKVCKLSRSLKNLGIKKGDIVIIYMHNSIELIISALSCCRIGATHNIIFGAYTQQGLGYLLNIYTPTPTLNLNQSPKLIITSNYGLLNNDLYNFYQEIKESIINLNINIENIILFNRNDYNNNNNNSNNNDQNNNQNNNNFNIFDWNDLVNGSDIEPLLEYELVESNHPIYIINTSGTTSKPKAIVRETAGHIVSLSYSFNNIYKINQGDTYFSESSIGWVSGQNLIFYSCLFTGCKSVFIEGPLNTNENEKVRMFWSLIEKYNVNVVSIIPHQMNLMKMGDPNGEIRFQYNLKHFKHVTIGSEKVYEKAIDYFRNTLKLSIIIDYWQTESGFPMIYNSNDLDLKNCSVDAIGKVVPGYNIKIVSKIKNNNNNDQTSEIVIKFPLPPGVCNRLLGDTNDRLLYNRDYLNEFEGYFRTKDIGYYDENKVWNYCSRSDDLISYDGNNINAGVLEILILKIQIVSECCVIGMDDKIHGQEIAAILVVENKNIDTISLKNEINNIVKTNRFSCINIKYIIIVERLPKTRTGKKIKSLLTSIFNNKSFMTPPTLQHVSVIDELLIEYSKFKNTNNL